jgi:hypothetical protein
VDEQTLSLIEALTKLRTSKEDLDEIKLAQKKVRTPEGVEKYDQPIGTIITKDMIEQAAQKAAQAASKSLKSNVGSSGTTSSSTDSPSASQVSTPKPASVATTPQPNSPAAGGKAPTEVGVPANQTSADIDNFFVSSYVNNPSKATMGWVQKKDGSWYKQQYSNGEIVSETPLDDAQVNALVAMEKKGLIYTGHIPDPEPKSKDQQTAQKIKDLFDSGKTPQDPEVSKLISQLRKSQQDEPKKESESSKSTEVTEGQSKDEPLQKKSEGKTVEINGKQVKVGRYSRPKGFAKAFLIVHEDGTVEYEDKKGARKKITHKSFQNHQDLGMNKFLTEDTGPLKKGEHFEEGKLVKDEGGAPEAPAAKVEPMTKPTPEVKSAPAAEKPAKAEPKPYKSGPAASLVSAWQSKSQDLPKEDQPKKEKPPFPPDLKKESESGTVKIGNLTVKPGRYSRPKGFAKAFLIVHPDGTAEYENKKGERKKISAKSFEGHWKLGMNKFLTSDTKAIKSGEHFEDGKLVEDSSAPSKPEVKPEDKAQPVSPAIKAAQEASAALKEKQDQKVDTPPVKTKKINLANFTGAKSVAEVPEDAKIYVPDNVKNSQTPHMIYWKSGDTYEKWGVATGHSTVTPNGVKNVDSFISDGTLVEWTPGKGESKESDLTTTSNLDVKKVDPPTDSKKVEEFEAKVSPSGQGAIFPKGTEIYVPDHKSDSKVVAYFLAIEPNGDMWRVGGLSGVKKVDGETKKVRLEQIKDGVFSKWKKYHPNNDESSTPKVTQKKEEPKTISVSTADGKPEYKFPEGTQIYVTTPYNGKDTVGVFYALQPDGKLFRVGVSSGKSEKIDSAKDSFFSHVKTGDYSLWKKYHPDKESVDTANSGMFYVVIKGKPVHPVTSDTKVYKLGFLTDENDVHAKYFKDSNDKWHFVTSAGEMKANSDLTETLNKYFNNGELVEDEISKKDGNNYIGAAVTTPASKAEQAVDAGKEVSPATSPTEVKSVKISGMDIKPGKYSIGKEFAKAFLLVHPDGKTEYVNKQGVTKKLTPAAFKKNWDAGMNKYAGPIDAAAGPEQSQAAPTVFHGPKPGVYYTQAFDITFDSGNTLEIFEDGSAMFKKDGATIPIPSQGVLDTIKYGTVLDEFGNSVVIPNLGKPEKVHLFGSTNGISLSDLQDFRKDVVEGNLGVLTAMKKYMGASNIGFHMAYAKKYFPGDASANKKALIKSIDDILNAVGAKAAEKPSVAGVPDPVKTMLQQDEHGYFKIPDGMKEIMSMPQDFSYLSSSGQNQAIKKISQDFDGVIATAPSKMSVYAKTDWYVALLKGDFKQMYALEKNAGMTMNPLHPGAPDNKDTHNVLWEPAVAGELPAGKIPPGDWSTSSYDMTTEELSNYLIAANMANPTHISDYHKKHWVQYHMAGDKAQVDKMSLKAKFHSEKYPNEPYSTPPVWTDGVKPKKAYTDYYNSGDSVDNWSHTAAEAYVKDFPELIPSGKDSSYVWNLTSDIQNHVDTAKAAQAAKEAAEYAEKMKPKFTKVPGQGVSGGHHEAMVVQDQFGQKWVYKPRQQNDIFLADVEQAAHELSWAWGYKTSKSFITKFDNREGHVQQMFDAEKDLNGVPVSSLNSSQIQDLAKEHLLDWALDNDDSWGANLLMLKNGSIVGIDKGRAFVGIGHWNGLTADSNAHVHMPLVYTDLYNAIANKSISQDDANAAYFAVMKQARKMQTLSDSRMTEILEAGFKNRKNWSIGGGPDSKEGAIAAALARKNNLVEDMETLWGNVFKKAGYDKPEKPDNVVTNADDQDIHLGITPAALQQAKDNGSYGASVFFGGPEIEDSHLLLYHTKNKEGIDQLNGEMKIRETTNAFKDVEKWLKDNAVKVDNAYGFTPSSMKPTLPNEADYYQKIIEGVKTISTHALDGQYNADKLNGMSWVKNTLQNYVDGYDNKMSDPAGQKLLVSQYKDPEAFLNMAKQYLGYIAKAEQHKANGTKSSPGEFDKFVWTPKKEELPEPTAVNKVKVELRAASSPKVTNSGVPQFNEDGSLQHHVGMTTDGNPGSMYVVTLPTGETIEFRGNTTGTPAASKGLTRFTMPAGDNEAASLERIRSQMADMGLSMSEASEDDLELYYWRHLAGIMDARADSKKTASVYSKTTNSPKYKEFQKARPVETANMSAAEELEAWKNAFAKITSREQIDQFVGSGGHLPKFGHYHTKDQAKYSGQPYWERFDVTDDEVFTKQLPGSAFSDDAVGEYLTYTGGMFSTEARLRTLGLWKEGMSSTSDMSHGSSGFVFIRQNLEVKSNSASYGIQSVYYSPKILKRTHNYSFDDDKYGEMNSKPEASYFDFDALTQHQGGTNEIMVKHAVSLLDDIEIVTFTDPDMRDRAIKALKALGIDEIRGVPVEKRFVMRNKNDVLEAQKIVKEAWKK